MTATLHRLFPGFVSRFLIIFVILATLYLAWLAYLRWGLEATFFVMTKWHATTEHQPSDSELIHVFEVNRSNFEQLSRMALEDGSNGDVLRIDSHGITDQSNMSRSAVSSDRQKEYERLLHLIASSLALEVIPNHYVDFSLASGDNGTLGVDWNKGLRYIPEHPEKEGTLLRNIDEAKKGDGDEFLRQVESHWFVYHESY